MDISHRRRAKPSWSLFLTASILAALGGHANAQDLSVFQNAHGGGIVITPGTGNEFPQLSDLTPEGNSLNTTWEMSPGAAVGQSYAKGLKVTGIPDAWVPTVTPDLSHAVELGADLARAFLADPNKHVNREFCEIKGASLAPEPPPFDRSAQAPRSQGPARTPGAVDAAGTNGVTTNSDPVNPANGELVIAETDLQFPGFGVPFRHTRTYRSRVDYDGPLGHGWDHGLNRRLISEADGSCAGVTYSGGDGTSLHFVAGLTQTFPLSGNLQHFEIGYQSPPGVRVTLHAAGTQIEGDVGNPPHITQGEWRLVTADGMVEVFDERGVLTRIEDANHYGLSITWEEGHAPGNLRIAEVTDSVERVIKYEYDGDDHLTALRHEASGLKVTYDYANGELISATSSDGRTEHYAYDHGHPEDAATIIPEGQLRDACERVCGPAGSACDAAGVCDNIAAAAMVQCKASCNTCPVECGAECHSYCTDSLGEGRQACVNQQGVNGQPSCSQQCQGACQEQTQPSCDAFWHGDSLDPATPPPAHSVEEECGYCEQDCHEACGTTCNNIAVCLFGAGVLGAVTTGAGGVAGAIACFGTYGFEDGLNDLTDAAEAGFFGALETFECVADTICGWFGASCGDCEYENTREAMAGACNDSCTACCAYGDRCSNTSCQAGHRCKDDCRDAFYGHEIAAGDHGGTCQNSNAAPGCLDTFPPACMGQCDSDCAKPCTEGCNAQCGDACADACGVTDGSCVTQCEHLDYVGACRQGCAQECEKEGRNGAPPKYGHLSDLNHNLTTVFNADWVPYLVNTYGDDPGKADFDAVVTQVNAGHAMSFEYRDLMGEVTGVVAMPLPGTKIGGFASALTKYESVEICPRACKDGEKNSDGRTCTGFEAPLAPRREASLRPRSQLPVSATVVTDAYGVTWTFYYDSHGRTLRQVNWGTGAVRSFDYNSVGDLIGVEQPLRDRMCLKYDASGNLIQSFQFPEPGALGDSAPIQSRWSYKSFPSRLETVSDPRDPSHVLTTYAWDGLGRLLSITDAVGSVTTFTPNAYGLPGQIVGPSGAIEVIEYDESAGLPWRVTTDAGGASPVVRTVAYDAAGRPMEAIGPLGEQLKWYWEGGTLSATQASADGVEAQTKYEIIDGRVRAVVHDQRRVETSHDLLGLPRVTRATALDGSASDRRTCTNFGPGARLLDEIRPDGSRVHYSYDPEGRLVEVFAGSWPRTAGDGLDPVCAVATPGAGEFTAGSLGTTTYDKNGRATLIKDASGEETHLVYDGFGRVATVTDARGTSHRAGYDAMGNVVWTAKYAPSAADAAYKLPTYAEAGHGLVAAATATYDAIGRVKTQDIWQFDPAGAPIGTGPTAGHAITTYEYRPHWNQVAITNPVGEQSVQTFDGVGRLVLTQFATSDTEAITYLDGGRSVLREWSAPTQDGMLSERTRLTAWGAPSQVENTESGSLQVIQTYSYDRDRRPIGVTGIDGASQAIHYDAFGQVVASEKRVGTQPAETVAIHYDQMGRVLFRSSDAANGRGAVASSFTYDVLGRLRAASYPGGRTEDFTYKLGSDLIATSHDPRGVTLNYLYTGGLLDSLTAVPTVDAATATQRLSYARDALGRPVVATHTGASYTASGDDVVTTISYDSLGNKLQEWNSQLGESSGVRTTPDAVGRPKRSIYGALTFERQFDGLGRLTDLRLPGDAVSTAHFDYDGLGGPKTRSLATGVVTAYGYDPLGRLKTQKDTRGAAQLASWRWEQGSDSVPRVAGLRRNGGAETSSVYQVDAARRVIAERQAVVGLDGLSLAADASPMASNSMVEPFLSMGLASRYRYDGRSNWAQKTSFSPTLGLVNTFPTVDDKDAYTTFGSGVPANYDARGALTSVGPASEQYAYDTLGNLVMARKGPITKTYAYDAFGRRVSEQGPEGVTRYGYDGLARAVRRAPSGQTDVTIDGDGDEHIVRVSGSVRHFYHQDRARNVYLVTDGTGHVAEWYDYTAFGEMAVRAPDGTLRTASAIANRFGFHGQPVDLQLGLVDMRARAYKPTWGRFVSPDPIGYRGGSNLYSFVNGAALSFWDPLGLSARDNELALKAQRDLANLLEQQRVDAMFERESSFSLGDAMEIVSEMPADAWRGVKGLSQGTVDGVRGTAHALLHPVNTVNALGTFLGESGAKLYMSVEGGIDLGAMADRVEQALIQGDPSEVAYGAGHAAGVFDGGALAGAGGTAAASAAVKAGLGFVEDSAILNSLVAGERAAARAALPGLGAEALNTVRGYGDLFSRPGFWKETLENAKAAAPVDDLGNVVCETCGEVVPETITRNTSRGPVLRRGGDLDHFPDTWAERVAEMRNRFPLPTREEVIRAFNERLRYICPICNQSHEWEGIPGPYRPQPPTSGTGP